MATFMSAQIKIAVYVSGILSDEYNVLLGDNLVEAFSENERYIAVNRSDALNSLLDKARSFQENGRIDLSQVANATKGYGETQLCAVDVLKIEHMYVFRASLLDIEKNTVIKTASAEAPKDDFGYTKCIEIAKRLQTRLLPESKQVTNDRNDIREFSDIDLARRRVEENKIYDISYAEYKENTKVRYLSDDIRVERYLSHCPAARYYENMYYGMNLAGGLVLGCGGGGIIFALGMGIGINLNSYPEDERNQKLTIMLCGMGASLIPGIVILSVAPVCKKKAWKAYRKPYDDAVKDLIEARKYQRSSSLQFYPTGGFDWAGIGMKVTFN